MKTKTIIKNIEADIYQLIADCENANEQYSKNKLTSKRYETLRYIYSCRAQYLLKVLQSSKECGVSFDLPVKLDKLPSDFSLEEINLESIVRLVAEDLSKNVDMKSIGRLIGLKQAMKELSDKYAPLLPHDEELTLN